MTPTRQASTIWKQTVGHPIRLLTIGAGALLLLFALTMSVLTWRSLDRVQLIDRHRTRAASFTHIGQHLQALLLRQLAGESVAGEGFDTVRVMLRAVLAEQLEASERAHLQALTELVGDTGAMDVDRLATALGEAQGLTLEEEQVERTLLTRVQRDASRERQLAFVVLGVLPLFAVAVWVVVRRRVLRPLDDLRALFLLLARGEFRTVEMQRVDPIVAPLFENFNFLIRRLEELEKQHRRHARSLEREVSAATKTLLAQHRALAEAERLAAVGEMAAGLAHELRNPLAGISVTLNNLRRDLEGSELLERLDPVIAELQRMTRLLNEHLALARHAPEKGERTNLCALVVELLALVRYQVAEGIQLTCEVPEALVCHIPRDSVRQAILNLLLNAAQALGEGPGAVVVSAATRGGDVVLEVADDGPGFPDELLQHGVRAFTTGREGGTGLGLAIVRRVAQDLGGALELENRQPRGAVVRLTLPCR